jgi:predicted transcriptional regulator
VQDLINSFVRLSAAITVYSMQQMQSAVETIDPKDSVTRLRKMLDSMTEALTAQIDESKKPTVDSMSNLGSDVVERTFDSLNVSGLTPKDFVQTTSDIVKKTSDSLAGMIKTGEHKKASSSTPQEAGEILVASH